ncbi:50S ribosomal protein L24 [Fervidicoccus fontis]|uniref:Large ribosomal subunit protein uL24 n=1 Tax=Fervidicoccus fontis TaxID=683846 RepID=A0A2J6N306_9CREN|nr:50S ribosomal protein L24 [Fervidicoccus fontis]PMB75724.1 MAG: 50S ribosomal protein L24 [Fervidicoccus fontis]PMB78110.1 MAG: 50S ribosomal protein L24 [Fervidicoccus fontis]HEW64176.1 50S ribosomal protein L24 [Fervidicoccus fontis]
MSLTKSIKPKKQRKILFNAPLHIREKLVTSPLSKELRNKYGIKRLPVRSGDTVKIMRGNNAGLEGKVVKVNRKTGRVHIEKVTRDKADGTPVFIPIHASKVMITKLYLSDKERKQIIERKTGRKVIEEKEEEKKETETAEAKEEKEESKVEKSEEVGK